MSPEKKISWLDARLLLTLEQAFLRHAGADGIIDVADLKRALGISSTYLVGRVIASLDADRDGVVKREDFLGAVKRLVYGTDAEKLAFAFRMHDADDDGRISQTELLRMICVSLGEAGLVTHPAMPPARITQAVFQAADIDGDGFISFPEFERVLRRYPALLEKMTWAEAMWIAPNEDLLARIERPTATKTWSRLVENHGPQLVLLIGFVVTLSMVIIHGVTRLEGNPPWAFRAGHAAGRAIGLCAALVLVPVLRRILSALRATSLGRVLPIDDAIAFHRLLGHGLLALSSVHGVAFLVAYAQGHRDGFGIVRTARGATGLAAWIVLGVLWFFARDAIRRSRRFELFYFSHLLYVVWLALALVHAPRLSWWLATPLLAFGIEQLLRLRRRGRRATLLSMRPLRSGVTRLDLERPPGFDERMTDYVFLRIPALAKHEWHPFTLSSTPQGDALTVHVRALGNWTNGLRDLAEARERATAPRELEVFVDGPYGASSARLSQSRFAVMIGAGIGATPFASVIGSIVRPGSTERPMRIERAHFYWLNRDPYAFEWFAELLAEAKALDAEDRLDLHLCFTAGRTHATAMGLELAREILHETGHADLVTGLRTKTRMGHPDWDRELAAIMRQHAPAPVDVFFCGPPGLGQKLAPICRRLGLRFFHERF